METSRDTKIMSQSEFRRKEGDEGKDTDTESREEIKEEKKQEVFHTIVKYFITWLTTYLVTKQFYYYMKTTKTDCSCLSLLS